MIELSDQTRVDAPRDALWQALSEPPRLAEALPNVTDLRVTGAESFSATIRPETSTGLTAFDMAFRLHDLAAPERMTIDGRAVQAEHAVELTATLQLAADGDATIITWQVDARFLGPLAALGQRVLPDLVRNEIRRALHAAAALAAPVA